MPTPTPGPACPTLTCAPPSKPYLGKLRWTVILLPGARTLLLLATHAPTPATAHETLCPQTTPTGEEVAAARALDRYLEDLGMANRWFGVAGGKTRPQRLPGPIVGQGGKTCISMPPWIGWGGFVSTVTPVPPYLLPRGKEQVVSKATDISLYGLPIAAQ